jgi:hypothetical protein
MKLIRARVTNYRSIDDSGWVTLENVTCMVGKNESGKTAFLQALRRLNPVDSASGKFSLRDYPRKGYVRYRRRHDSQPDVVVRAEFELSDEEIADLESNFGQGVMRSRRVMASKNYKNQRAWQFDIDETAVIRHLVESAGLPDEIRQYVSSVGTWQDLQERLQSIETTNPAVDELMDRLPENDLRQQVVLDHLEQYLPVLVYFDNYSTMRGRISIEDIKQRRSTPEELDDADRTFLALLSMVGSSLDELEHETNFEYLKAELESASIGISDEIFEFWKQNKQLRVQFDLSSANPNDPPPLNSGTILHVRVWNNRHRVSVPFDERSKGFVWFFSFLVYFSMIEKIQEEQDRDMIFLLDEPGLNLHALAQYDLQRFINERLAPKHQVVYTTHSPFMIDLNNLTAVRTVEDMDNLGTTISQDILQNSDDTVFPLQMALGFQLVQTLFLAPHCLLVGSASDLIYLQVLGEMCVAERASKLDPRWVVIPVGNAENLPTFISLLGDNYLSLAVLMDVTEENRDNINQINDSIESAEHTPVNWIEVTRVRDADIEDLLDPGFYLRLVNQAYARQLREPITLRAISDSNPRIVERLKSYFHENNIGNGEFDPYKPAAILLKNHAMMRGEINQVTIDSASSMFDRINSMLSGSGVAAGYKPANGGGIPIGFDLSKSATIASALSR